MTTVEIIDGEVYVEADDRETEIIEGKVVEGVAVSLEYDGEDYFIRLSKDDHGAFVGQYSAIGSAQGAYMRVLRSLGDTSPYEPPVFMPQTVDPRNMSPRDVFNRYVIKLGGRQSVTDEANAVRQEMMTDPLFVDNAREILEIADVYQNGNWVTASIRATCRRLIAIEEAQEKRERATIMSAVDPEFGRF